MNAIFSFKIYRGVFKRHPIIILLVFNFLFYGCSSWFSKNENELKLSKDYQYHSKKDYLDHLSRLGESFLDSNTRAVVKVSSKSYGYINDILENIVRNNEVILSKDINAEIFIVKDNRPFHFSFPGGKIIISSSLIKNYIKSEGVLTAVITLELIKLYNGIYKRNLIVPLGFLSYEDVLPYLKITLEDKEEVNKWAFYSLKRSGYDPLSLLKLIQIKNKNFLDFLSVNETSDSLSREETLLKSFLIRNKLIDSYKGIEKNSSQEFYVFLNEVKRRS